MFEVIPMIDIACVGVIVADAIAKPVKKFQQKVSLSLLIL
jgi:hypothetical protein